MNNYYIYIGNISKVKQLYIENYAEYDDPKCVTN